MDRQGALCSHAPHSFASTPEIQPDATTRTAARLLFKSHWKLSTESAREEPRLRIVLGHISVYDRTKAFAQTQPGSMPVDSTTEENELSTYIQHEVPSFEEFRAALQVQLQTITEIRLAAAAQCEEVDEYDSAEDTDSEYDSCDGECWSEGDLADSDDSLTDNESEGEAPQCTSPTFDSANTKYDKAEEEDDLWAIQPPATLPEPQSSGRPFVGLTL